MRFGGDEEVFWGDYFNGAKEENLWVSYVPPERLARERRPIEIFGVKIAQTERRIDVGRRSWRASATSGGSRRAAATCG